MRMLSMLILAAAMAQIPTPPAAEVTMAWDPPAGMVDGTPLTNLGGYRVYYGASSRDYDTAIDVGNVTTTTVSRLTRGTRYYFAVTAYTTGGGESDYSAEISWTPKRMGSVIRIAADMPPRRLWIGRE